jgi:hypothetical protein
MLAEGVSRLRLSDGSRLDFNVFDTFNIKADTKTFLFDYTWHAEGVEWSHSLVSILVSLLQTRSPDYSHQCQYYAGRFVKEVLYCLPALTPNLHLRT